MLTSSEIAALYLDDPDQHRRAAEAAGLVCPADVFEQLFHEPRGDNQFAQTVDNIDWQNVRWREVELSGAALVESQIPRTYEHAVEEARAAVLTDGLQDERAEVVAHWREQHTWFRSPILVTGDVSGSPVAYELLVGFTRVGNLLGLIDQDEVLAAKKHRVWIGETAQ